MMSLTVAFCNFGMPLETRQESRDSFIALCSFRYFLVFSIPLRYNLFFQTFHKLVFYPFPPHLAIYFLVYLSIMFFPKHIYIYKILWRLLLCSILCSCPNQRNLFNLIYILLFSFPLSNSGPKIRSTFRLRNFCNSYRHNILYPLTICPVTTAKHTIHRLT